MLLGSTKTLRRRTRRLCRWGAVWLELELIAQAGAAAAENAQAQSSGDALFFERLADLGDRLWE